MRRAEQPTFSITQAENGQEDQERAQRLALFLSTLREKPEVFEYILSRFTTTEDAIENSGGAGPTMYGRSLAQPEGADPDATSYEDRVLHVVGQLFLHEDDEHMRLDDETFKAFQRNLQSDVTDYETYDDRISARRVAFLAAFVSEFTQVDTLGVRQPEESAINEVA